MLCKKDLIFYNKRTNESCSWSDLCCRLDLVLIFHLSFRPPGVSRQNNISWVHYWPEGVGVLPLKLYQNNDLTLVFFSVPLALVWRCRYQVWTFFHMFPLTHAKVAFCTLLTTHQQHLHWCRTWHYCRHLVPVLLQIGDLKIRKWKEGAGQSVQSGDRVENKQKRGLWSGISHLSLISCTKGELQTATGSESGWSRAEECFISWNSPISLTVWVTSWRSSTATNSWWEHSVR